MRRRQELTDVQWEKIMDLFDLPEGLPVIADKGHDSDALRDDMEAAGFLPIIPHRGNRVKPSRNDGRRLRRYRHRWLVERTNVWLHCYRGLAMRWSYYPFVYVGLVYVSLSIWR